MSDESYTEVSQSSMDTSELNGKDASYRHAPTISEPRLVRKLRIRGALVPMRQDE